MRACVSRPECVLAGDRFVLLKHMDPAPCLAPCPLGLPRHNKLADGDPDPRPLSQSHRVQKPKMSSSKEGADPEDTGSSLAESVCIESAARSDSDSSEEEDGGSHHGPPRTNSHSAHGGGVGGQSPPTGGIPSTPITTRVQ